MSERDPAETRQAGTTQAGTTQAGTTPTPTGRGFGRTLVFVYGVMAFSATGRSSFQLLHQFHEAPVPYALSAFSAVVYIVATFALARNHWHTALAACLTELVGVLVIGTSSVTLAKDFPDATVWSQYGLGYGCLPLVLPMVGLYWLWRRRGERRTERT